MEQPNYIGIDISKDSFIACGSRGNRKFSNDANGYIEFRTWAESPFHGVMEAGGPYGLRFAHQLHSWEIPVSRVNPLSIRRYCQMNLKHAKTDRKDAGAIFMFAKLTNPPCWVPDPTYITANLQRQTVARMLIKHLIAIKASIKSLDCRGDADDIAMRSLVKLSVLKRQEIAVLEKAVESEISRHETVHYQLLRTIPGLGPKTAVMLILHTNAFRRVNTSKAAAALFGLAPTVFRSGASIHRRAHISRAGPPEFRRLLYMCSLTAIRKNEPCKKMYERLRERGKPARVALTAVCHKLVRQAFGVVTSGKPFDPAFIQNQRATIPVSIG